MIKLKEYIYKIYKWFCHDVMCREFYTYQLSRQVVHHGIIFWIGFNIIMGCMYYVIFNLEFWWKLLAILVIILLSWLTDHLIDEIRLNPDKYKE